MKCEATSQVSPAVTPPPIRSFTLARCLTVLRTQEVFQPAHCGCLSHRLQRGSLSMSGHRTGIHQIPGRHKKLGELPETKRDWSRIRKRGCKGREFWSKKVRLSTNLESLPQKQGGRTLQAANLRRMLCDPPPCIAEAKSKNRRLLRLLMSSSCQSDDAVEGILHRSEILPRGLHCQIRCRC